MLLHPEHVWSRLNMSDVSDMSDMSEMSEMSDMSAMTALSSAIFNSSTLLQYENNVYKKYFILSYVLF